MNHELVELPEENIEGDELYQRHTFRIDKGQEPVRIDKFVTARIEGATRNKVQQAIAAGMITVNGMLLITCSSTLFSSPLLRRSAIKRLAEGLLLMMNRKR